LPLEPDPEWVRNYEKLLMSDAGPSARERPERLSKDEVAAIRGHRVAHAWLSPGAHRALEVEAKRRCLHPDRLAARILEQVLIHDGALDAIVGA
jgi:hypothetical protein